MTIQDNRTDLHAIDPIEPSLEILEGILNQMVSNMEGLGINDEGAKLLLLRATPDLCEFLELWKATRKFPSTRLFT